jgi:hypothetical protein
MFSSQHSWILQAQISLDNVDVNECLSTALRSLDRHLVSRRTDHRMSHTGSLLPASMQPGRSRRDAYLF